MAELRDEAQIRWLPIEDLHLDPENPRIPASIDGGDESEVLRWLLEDASLLDLMRSIAAQGYFAGEPLLVIPRALGGYTVVEGNRRLASLRLLSDPMLATAKPRAVANIVEGAEHRPTVVPVVVFDAHEDLVDYLGYRHVTGVKQWEPLAKARYTRKLWEVHLADTSSRDEALRRVADILGSRRDYVARTLTALELYSRLIELDVIGGAGVPLHKVDFSYLTVALNNSPIPDWLGIESSQNFELVGLKEETLARLGQWLFVPQDETGRTILGESRNIGKLAAVVENPDAVAELIRTGDLDHAAEVTNFAADDLLTHVLQARDSLAAALRLLPSVSWFDPNDLEALHQIVRSARSLNESLRSLGSDDFRDLES